MRYILVLLVFLFVSSCNNSKSSNSAAVVSFSLADTTLIATKDFRVFKILDSKHLTKSEIWKDINLQMDDFSEEDYERLKPYIFEQDILSLQQHISKGNFNYEQLTKFYLYRIRQFDRENALSLNAVISINPEVISQAKMLDNTNKNGLSHPIFGMPILLKDNINAKGMSTTAGAVVLKDNFTNNAFIVNQLQSKGALILGKANLSEWAYFFCEGCPSGYSAIGGQTLNPYGRRIFDTGGSSSGSGVSVAANFCAAAIGSETSGSILSPASQNSVVGLKPTIGLVSRSGIVPISSTLDTAGPMTKTVQDNAIVLDALFGEDLADKKSIKAIWDAGFYFENLANASLKGKRFGAPKRLLEDTLFQKALVVLKQQGAEIIEIEEEKLRLPNFIRLLNIDMKNDLPNYLAKSANRDIKLTTVSDIFAFNEADSVLRMPYGQQLFKGIIEDTGDDELLDRIKDTLKTNGQQFFDKSMKAHQLDGFLSINNYHAGFAAVAEYPALTVPMGYTEEGAPRGLTFISRRLREKQLLEWAYVYEQASKMRQTPADFN